MSEPTLVYLVGMPGAGKSTLAAALTADCHREPVDSVVPHDALARAGKLVGAELGRRRDNYSGTDALKMSIQRRAEAWISSQPYPLVIGEGQRLSNRAFLAAAETGGYRVRLLYVDVPSATAAARRAGRPTEPDPRWTAGVATMARNVAAAAEESGWLAGILDGTKPLAALVFQAQRMIPELEALS